MGSLLTKVFAGLLTLAISVALLVAICSIGPLLGLLLDWIEILRRKTRGEVLPLEEAVKRVERGRGYIVVNRSGEAGLGRIWWSPEYVDDETLERDSIMRSRAVLTDALLVRRVRARVPADRITVLRSVSRR